MKQVLTTILCFVVTSLMYAQNNAFVVDVNNRPLMEVLKEVEKKYDIFFSYKVKEVKNIRVNLKTEATSINSLLQQLLAKTNLQFEIADDNFIVVKQKQATLKSTISGTVYDNINKTPLPYANIIIENTSTGVIADEAGNFKLQYEPENHKRLVISYVGYEAQTIEIAEFISKKSPAILLNIPEVKEAFLVISDYLTDGISVENNGAATNIKPRAIGNIPGNIEPDIFSTIQFLPGVATPASSAFDIYIRGCTPDQNLVIWEDIPIYHTAHYFGMISSINPYIIENTNVYRGGFNATYGGRIGGVIELLSPDETAYKSYFGIGANMTHAQAYTHQKFKLAERQSSITFSLRRSYNEIYETPTFENYTAVIQQGTLFNKAAAPKREYDISNDFYFLDANLKFSTQINEKNKFQLAAVYAINDFNDEITDRSKTTVKQTDSIYINYKGISLKWQHYWNSKVATVAKAIFANDSLSYLHKIVENNAVKGAFAERDNVIADRQLVLHNSFKLKNKQNLQAGYHFTNYNISYHTYEKKDRSNAIKENYTGKTDLHALYVLYQNPIENKIGVEAGIRANYSQLIKNNIRVEPRIRLDYRLFDWLSLHSSFGTYHQMVSEVEVFKGNRLGFETSIWELADEQLKVQKSLMYQAGLIFQKNNWVIDLQAYQRKVSGISSRAYSIDAIPDNRPEDGNSNIVGIDLLVKKRIGRFRTWLSYSLSKSNLTFKIDRAETTFPSNYDQRHILDWSNQLRLNNWHISAAYKISSGLPYTQAIDFEYQKPEPQQGDFPFNYRLNYGSVNAKNLPSNSIINLSVNYQLKSSNQKWRANFAGSIINLLNTNNIFERRYYIENEKGKETILPLNKTSIPFTPNVSIRLEW